MPMGPAKLLVASLVVCLSLCDCVKLAPEVDPRTTFVQEMLTDVCGCANWGWAYYHWELQPGAEAGFESLTHYEELNEKFFSMQNHSYCIKKEFRQEPEPIPYPGSWCYDSSACEELNGGKKANAYASAKICGASDKALSDLGPNKIVLVTGMIEDPQAAMLMAYPWNGEGEMSGAGKPLLEATGSRANAMLLGGQRVHSWGVIGNAERHGFLAVIGNDGNEHWEIGNTAADIECSHGCAA